MALNIVKEKLRPKLVTIVQNFKTLATQPMKIVQLFGGQIAAQLLVILALGAALHAFGTQLSVAALVIAATMAGVLVRLASLRRREHGSRSRRA